MINYNKRNKAMFALALVFLLLGIAGLVLLAFFFDYRYYILGGSGAALLLSFIFFLIRLGGVRGKRKQNEMEARSVEEALMRLSYGESVNLDSASQDPNLTLIKDAVNEASLQKNKPLPAPGVLEEEDFDETVLRILLEKPTPLASLTYFKLTCDKKFDEEGPLDALLSMLRTNFGEEVYYGRIDDGYAVFVPVVYSRAESVGKARQVVQLYSYAQGEAKISSKASTAFYPDFAPRVITSEAIKGLALTKSTKVKVLSAKMDRFGYPASEEVNAMTDLSVLKKQLSEAKNEEEVMRAISFSAHKMLSYVGLDSLGLAVFTSSKRAYRLLELTLPPYTALKKVAKNGYMGMDTLDPFFNLSKEEGGFVYLSSPMYLPSKPRAILDSYTIASAAVEAVYDGEEKLGLVYLLSHAKLDMPLERYNTLKEYCFVLASALRLVATMEGKAKTEARSAAFYSSMSGYGYAVDEEKMTLTFLSPNLAQAIPEAKPGMKCHKALYGSNAMCAKCPLKERLVEKAVPKLGSGTFALFCRPGFGESEILIASRKEDFSSARIDPVTGLYNEAALHEDLQKEILLKEAEGFLLAFQVRNAPALVRQFRMEEGDYAPILSAVTTALTAASLTGSLYRYGDYGFVYLLPALSHEEGEGLAEKVAKTLRGKLPLGDKTFEAFLDFALMEYPLEASNPFDMDSLLRTLYSRAAASSKGRLFENSEEQGRIADQQTYVQTKMEEYLRSGYIPLHYGVFKENAGKRAAFLEALPLLQEEGGRKLTPLEALDLIDASKKERAEKEAELASIAKMLGINRKAIDASSLIGAILPLNWSCFDPHFVDLCLEQLKNRKAMRAHLYLEVSEADFKEHKDDFLAFAKRAKDKGLRLGLANYEADLSEEELAHFAYVRFPSSKVYGQSRDTFITALSTVRAQGLSFLVDGISSKEEMHYLGSLSLHYGKLEEEELAEDKQLEELLK